MDQTPSDLENRGLYLNSAVLRESTRALRLAMSTTRDGARQVRDACAQQATERVTLRKAAGKNL